MAFPFKWSKIPFFNHQEYEYTILRKKLYATQYLVGKMKNNV